MLDNLTRSHRERGIQLDELARVMNTMQGSGPLEDQDR